MTHSSFRLRATQTELSARPTSGADVVVHRSHRVAIVAKTDTVDSGEEKVKGWQESHTHQSIRPFRRRIIDDVRVGTRIVTSVMLFATIFLR